MKTIQEQARRCRTIIQGLLQFSRRQEPHKQSTDIAPLLKSTLQLLNYDISTSGIQVVQGYPDSLPPVYLDGHQIQQVLLNLLSNARHASKTSPIPKLRFPPDRVRLMCGFPCRTMGVGFLPIACRKFTIHFLQPNRPEKARVWDCRSVTVSWKITMAVSLLKAK